MSENPKYKVVCDEELNCNILKEEESLKEEIKKEKELSKSELRKSIINFTWPCMAELMLISLIAIVNQAMVGHLGAYALAAVGLTNQPLFVGIAVFQSFNIGATALVARFIGSKEFENAKSVVIQTLMISIISGVVLSALGFIFADKIVLGMGAKEDTYIYARMYMRYMSIGFIFQAIPTAITSILRGAGDTKSPMRFNIVANIVNILAGFLLIYGFFFIPALGVQGAAIGTTLAKVTSCILSIHALMTCKLPIAISIRDKFKFDGGMLKRIMNIGFAAAGEQLAMRVGFIIYTKIIADLGTVPFAAHQLVISITSLSFNFGQALGMASTSFMGRNLGMKRPDRAAQYCNELRKLAMGVSIIISLCFFFFGRQIASLFTGDQEVIAITAYLLKLVILMTPAQNSQMVTSGGLRGAGDTRWPLLATISGVLFIRVPLVIILIKGFGFGVGAAWVAGIFDQYARFAVVYARFLSGKWKKIKV